MAELDETAKTFYTSLMHWVDRIELLFFSLGQPFKHDKAMNEALRQIRKAIPKDQIDNSKANNKIRCFLVDDESAIGECMSDFLKVVDLSSTIFTEPRKALEEIKALPKEQQPDLLITDICMPTMSGIELIKAIKESGSNVPVVVVSGFVDKETSLEALKLGVSAIIEKPFEFDILVQTARQVILNHQLQSIINDSVSLVGQITEPHSAELKDHLESIAAKLVKAQKEETLIKITLDTAGMQPGVA